jgi:hypothetical protein
MCYRLLPRCCTIAAITYHRDTLSDTNLADLGIIMSQIRRKVRTRPAVTHHYRIFQY